MTERVLKKLRDFRLKLQAEIAEMESYGINTTKQREKLNKAELVVKQRNPQEITLVNVK